MGAKGIVRGHEVVTIATVKEKREKEKEREWEHHGGGEPSECAVVSKKEVEKRTATAERGRRGESEQTTGKKSAASKAAPPRLNFRIYRTKIVV